MGAGALAPGRVCTEFPKDKEFRAFEMLEKIELSSKPRRCVRQRTHSDQDNYDSEDDLGRAFQVEERKRRNRWIKRNLHKSNQPRRMFIPTGSKSTANEEPAPDEEMQWKYEVDEFGVANGIDNELKIRRWVIHQMAIDEKFVIRAADDFTWADEMAHDQVKEITNEEGEVILKAR